MPVTNKIILGTVQFGLNYGINNSDGKPAQKDINDILNTAYNAGIYYLDTAEAYGDAHQTIGRFHQDNPEHVFKVITKLPHHIDDSLNRKVDIYLEELKVTQLEAILFHSYQTYKDNSKFIGLLNRCKQANKIKHTGVSVYTNLQIQDVINDDNIDIIQLPFNVFDNLNQRGELLSKAKAAGKIIHVRSVFLQGLFFIAANTNNKVAESLSAELKHLRELSVKWNIPMQQIALNYALQQPDIDNVLIGIDNISQLKQNLDYSYGILPDKLIDEINSIIIRNTDLLNPSLWNQ